MAREELEVFIAEQGLTLDAVFVPWSQSRYKGEKPCLNWKVTLNKGGKPVLTTDYMAGSGHCPASNDPVWGVRNSVDRDAAVKQECETGKSGGYIGHMGIYKPRKAILPDLADVLACLAMDADVLDYGSFEEWADSIGYDSDSRKAEATYRACLETALQLRRGLGEGGLERLREAAQDY